jgi:hypothetical protein
MMGKFTSQLKELPGSVDLMHQTPLAESRPSQQISGTHEFDYLRAAQALLEREVSRPELAPAEAEALREVLFALRERNVARVGVIYRDALGEVKSPSEGVRQASDYLSKYFAQ